MKDVYVISIKKVKDYDGKDLPVEKQEFKYFQYDRYSGSMSTGYPCFGYNCHAEHFASVEDAINCFNQNFDALQSMVNLERYDLSTLAVRKVVFKKKHNLQWNADNTM